MGLKQRNIFNPYDVGGVQPTGGTEEEEVRCHLLKFADRPLEGGSRDVLTSLGKLGEAPWAEILLELPKKNTVTPDKVHCRKAIPDQ